MSCIYHDSIVQSSFTALKIFCALSPSPEPLSITGSPALQVDSLLSEPPEKPQICIVLYVNYISIKLKSKKKEFE